MLDTLSTGWGHDDEQVYKVSKPYVKFRKLDFENIWGIIQKLEHKWLCSGDYNSSTLVLASKTL
jgi:hypothetical protein